ncbi:MAG: bacterioferritin [Betaproteobacteria bacterium HGW-Betaproteobacteria-19]|nr:MAG: bacterioferritin [Betaproteobacteria bacterium HGW-Betaproteobacteria-19]
MYVCVCKAVTERHIGDAVRNGSSTLRHLRKELGVTEECGRCAVCARDCLRAALGEPKPDCEIAAPNAVQRASYRIALEAT